MIALGSNEGTPTCAIPVGLAEVFCPCSAFRLATLMGICLVCVSCGVARQTPERLREGWGTYKRFLDQAPSVSEVFECSVSDVSYENGGRIDCTFVLKAKKHVWVCLELLKSEESVDWLFVDNKGRRYSYESREAYEQLTIVEWPSYLNRQRVEMGPGLPPVRVPMSVSLDQNDWLFVQLIEPRYLVYDALPKGLYTVQREMRITYYDTADQPFDSRQATWLVTLPGTMSVR